MWPAVLVILLALICAPADARKPPCRAPQGATVDLDTRDALVWTVVKGEVAGTRVCGRRSRRRVTVSVRDGWTGEVTPSRWVSRPRYVAWASGHADHYGSRTVAGKVIDLSTGEIRFTGAIAANGGFGSGPDPTVETLRLTRRGSLLMSANEGQVDGSTHGVVVLLDRLGPRTLDRGASVAPSSARFAGPHAIWRNAGSERRAPLSE